MNLTFRLTERHEEFEGEWRKELLSGVTEQSRAIGRNRWRCIAARSVREAEKKGLGTRSMEEIYLERG